MAVVSSIQAGSVIEVSKATLAQPYIGVVPLTAYTGSVANAAAIATLSGTDTTMVYLSGFMITGTGATAAKVAPITLTGVTASQFHVATYAFAAGVTTANAPLIVRFDPPLQASGVNQPITVSCPASGAGGTNNTIFTWGFYSTVPQISVI